MADDTRWQGVVEALEREGFRARLQSGFLGALTIAVDLGDGWSASVTNGDGDLRAVAANDSLQVALDGPDLPGEGYAVTWWPPTHDLRRVAKDVAPLLRRLSEHPPAVPPTAIPEVIETVHADVVLRQLLAHDDPPTFSQVWSGFCDFARRMVADRDPAQDEDLLLFEAITAPRGTAISLVRQFTRADDDDADMEQVCCAITVEPDRRTRAIPSQSPIWGPGGGSAAAWTSEVEATPAFQAAVAGTIVDMKIHQSLV